MPPTEFPDTSILSKVPPLMFTVSVGSPVPLIWRWLIMPLETKKRPKTELLMTGRGWSTTP